MKVLPLDTWLRQFTDSLTGTIRRFPLVLLCVLTFAVAAMWMIHHENDQLNSLHEFIWKSMLLTALGVPWLFALTISGERLGGMWRFGPYLGLAILGGGALLLPPQLNAAPTAFWFSYFTLLITAHYLVAALPFIRRGEAGFWAYNRSLLTRFFEAGVYAAILCAGLELALLSMDKLFALKVNEHYYPNLFIFCAVLFHPTFFLAGIESIPTYESDLSFPNILKIFTQIVLAPLCAIYAAILYSYTLKIIFTHHWPDGWVALPVLLFSVAGIFAWLLLRPLRDSEDRWARWFCVNFPRILIPLTILLFLSMRVRILEYGFTEFRILGVVASFWLFAYSLYYSFTLSRSLRLVPLSLALVGFFMVFFACSISQKSQLARLEKMRELIQLSPMDFSSGLSKFPGGKFKNDFASTLRYIVNWHGPSILPADIVTPWHAWQKVNHKTPDREARYYSRDWRISEEILQSLGLQKKDASSEEEASNSSSEPSDCVCIDLDGTRPLPLDQAKLLYANLTLDRTTSSLTVGSLVFSLDKDGELSAQDAATKKPVDIHTIKDIILFFTPPESVPPGSHDTTAYANKVTAVFSSGANHYRFVLIHASGSRVGPTGHKHLSLSNLEFLIIKETPPSQKSP